jgi:hypothetical protein
VHSGMSGVTGHLPMPAKMVSMVWSRDRPRRERVAEGRVVSIRGEGAHGNVQELEHNGGGGDLDACSRPTRLDK